MDVLNKMLAAFASAFTQSDRLFSLHFTDAALDAELLPHTLAGEEHISSPFRFTVECLSSDAAIELKTLIGQGVDIAIHRDGDDRVISGLVTGAKQLGSDGGFARYALTIEPALAVLKLRRNSRVFQDKSVVDIVGLILDEHIKNNPVFAQCFRHREQLTQTHAPRSYCQQYRESDFDFISRLLREEGISYYFDFTHGADEVGLHTLVLFDAGSELNPALHDTIRFHRADATEADDAITQWHGQRQIHSGAVSLASFDYKGVYTQQGQSASNNDHGESGTGLLASLDSYDEQSLYYGSDNDDLNRYAQLRQQASDLNGKTFAGSGVVRGLGAGQTFALTQHPNHESDNDFVVLKQSIEARNNLPGEFDHHPLTQALSGTTLTDAGYKNHFEAVRTSIPIVPAYAHTEYAKPTASGLQTATVVGPAGEEIFTDELGRIKIQFHWARPQDHDTGTHGAGAANDDHSSCWVRVAMPSAGAQWGHQFIPRIGQEVIVSFVENDIDRPLVTGVVYNGQHTPPTFEGKGSLPANKTLSGIKTQEYKGGRHNELVFDDTTNEIRTTLSTEHGKTQLNQGFLIHPRTEGKGEARGEGFELRTDNAGAIRAAQGLLLTTEAQPGAGGKQLDRNSAQSQLDAAINLSNSLGDTAQQQTANVPETGKNNRTINVDSQNGSDKTQGHLQHLSDATRNLERNSNTDPNAKSGGSDQAGQQALLLLHGDNGSSFSTPQSLAIATGSNLDHIAQRDTHQSTGKRWLHNIGESISLFVAGAQNTLKQSLKLIVANGNIQIQAQSGELEITANKNIRLQALNQSQTWSAQKEILITCGGAYVRIGGGNIELHCPGDLNFKSSQHSVAGPASKNATLPALPQLENQKNWIEVTRHYDDLEPVKDAQYKITYDDGTVLTGALDGQGHARHDNVPLGVGKLEWLKDDSRSWQGNTATDNAHTGQAGDAQAGADLIEGLLK